MAVKPEYIKNLNLEDIKNIDQAEKKIDTSLQKQNYYGGQYVTVSISGLNFKAKQEIIKRYTKAGWKNVRFESCQRDGEWLSLQFP